MVRLQYYLGCASLDNVLASPPTWNEKWTRGGWGDFRMLSFQIKSTFSLDWILSFGLEKTSKSEYEIDNLRHDRL